MKQLVFPVFLIYTVPAVGLGLAVGGLWAIAVPAVVWFLLYWVITHRDVPSGDAAMQIYIVLGFAGAAGAAVGVGVRTLIDAL